MKKCKLCITLKADKKGSHIVPHFLLKRIDNQEGMTGRDKELGFVLSEFGAKSYFGRATSVAKIEEIFGEVTEEVIDKNKTLPLVEDYVFCSICEKKLAVIESAYANTLQKFDSPEKNYNNGLESFLSFLFWISVMWRLSIASRSGFRLKAGDQKRLRRILCRYLDLDGANIKTTNDNPDLKEIGYKVLRAPEYSVEHSTLLFCHPNYQKPYYLIIDEFVIALYFSRSYVDLQHQPFLNIPDELSKIVLNTPFKGELIRSVSPKVIDDIKEYFYNELSKRYLLNFSRDLDSIHRKFGGRGQLPQKVKEEIFRKMIHDEDVNFGNKYTIKHKAMVTYEVLSKYIKQ
ncbi:hypothetical protein MH928_15725 [Flavobacterium sp. WW92]|uniref:hypothetical protein n=1 Tax=unclassified Flavobacterium TaxID=196869 RepID=UPI002224BAD2|nr:MULTISPECIES: hypothetical protein [unclassified Flavobacterium]WDO12758.1 hypothetical protein MH928_15725 [Flavobacterium sp. WW92]